MLDVKLKLPQPWPITGGKLDIDGEPKMTDVVVTGHEDGAINIWIVSACKYLAHTHTHTYTHIHTYIHTHIHTHIHT